MTYQLLDIRNTEQYEKYGLSPLCEKVFAANGLREDQIEELLAGDDVLHTSSAPCVKAACERILAARKNHEKVFVGGDYDADGICSTAIMKKTLDLLHIENGYYIPDRFKEGYGLSAATVRLAYEKGYSLIMTVDNGVKAFEAMAEARRLNLDLIITDHHRIEEEIDAEIASDQAKYDCEITFAQPYREATRSGLAVRKWMEDKKLDACTVNFLTLDICGLPKMPLR